MSKELTLENLHQTAQATLTKHTMKTNTHQTAETFYDLSIRTEHCIHIASMLHDEHALPDIFDDVLFDLGEIDTSEIEGLDDTGTYSVEKFCYDIVNRKLKFEGFFVALSTPVPSYHKEHLSKEEYQFSWGHYTTQWFYIKDLNCLEKVASSFQQQVLERHYKRHLEELENNAD